MEVEALFSSLKDAVSLVADTKILAAAGGLTLVSLVGAVPRVGFVRACTVGWRSYFKKTYPLSVRKSEIHLLHDSIETMQKGMYLAVIGGKGYGKSCLIDTTLNRHLGVVKVTTESGADKDLIIDQVLRAIAGIRGEFFKPDYSARRVLLFHSILFKRPPTVVIRVPERLSGHQYADVPAAVRSLADEFGLRVIVNGSPNSIPPELLTTKRQIVITVGPMTREQIESIPEFEGFIGLLKAHQLDFPVWKVLGGSPAEYLSLKQMIDRLSLSNTATDVIIDQVKNYLLSVLSDALNMNILDSTSKIKQIVKKFGDEKLTEISKSELEKMGFQLDYPNEVFREVKRVDDWFIEPASSAVSLIISENVQTGAGVRALLEKLFKEASQKEQGK